MCIFFQGSTHKIFGFSIFEELFLRIFSLVRFKKFLKKMSEPLHIDVLVCFVELGTAQNDDFGGVEETMILVKIDDIYPEKKERHVATYIPQK